MASYKKKDKVTLAFQANVKRLRAEGAIILAEVMNQAISEMDEAFQEALNKGELLHIEGTREEMKKYLRAAAERELYDRRPVHALPKQR